MNKDLPDLSRILGITILIVIISGSFLGRSGATVNLYDTYFIMNSFTWFILLTLVALFLIGLVVSVYTRFKNKLYLRILVFSIFLLISGGMYIFLLFANMK